MKINKKWLGIGGGGFLVVAAATAAVVYMVNQPAPPPDVQVATTQEAADYLASDDFRKLSDDKKQQFVSEVFRSGKGRSVMREAHEKMTDEQRQAFREAGRERFQKQMDERMDKYFKLPPEERVAYLDEAIDRMQEMRNRPRPPRPSSDNANNSNANNQNRRRGGPGGGGRRHFSPDRMRNRLEHTSPERRAKFTEFFRAMQKRMKERGIEPRGPGGPRPH